MIYRLSFVTKLLKYAKYYMMKLIFILTWVVKMPFYDLIVQYPDCFSDKFIKYLCFGNG